ncbi:unnamed protein product [Eruca vesicaria subsp. sativa]|uniref:RING-type E3 ubiquitin transferase n=1 Tax=Eruca vesicaria subsp. sativa TaxID=29727 RepID=A0ABC8JQ81_ERUVS|nr:unnamed protein product [Eruca vesicaria subsp. sativa]
MNPKGLNRSVTYHYGSILQLHFLFLLFSSQAYAQAADGGSDMYGESYEWDPTMAILISILVSAFIIIGSFSIYIRRWLEQVMGMNDAHSVDRLPLSRTRARGIDASVIETFPTFRYSTVKMLKISKEALECSICLNEFEDDETLRLVPKCCHVFHPDCIDAWLQSHSTCPLCRANLVPVPGESVVSIELPGSDDDTPRSEITGDRNTVFGSPDARLIDSVALNCNQSMSRRSFSTGWNLAEIFTNFGWTSEREENLDRFTLRLPQDIHNKLVEPSLLKGHVTFPQMMSSKRGYIRTGSLKTDANYIYYERFDQLGVIDRKSLYRTCSCSINTSPSSSDDQLCAGTPRSLLLAMKSPFDWLFLGKDDDIGERSSDHHCSGCDSPSLDQVV